ncbi:MAG: ketoacyl-ACP synthase III [Bacteroidetes bacterium]|nr:ketoacyl-ACP synthase III [Bacteroidota bacterium]
MSIGIRHIEYYLPERTLTNDDFAHLGVDPDFMKTRIGIRERHIAAQDESVGDMAVKSCLKLLDKNKIKPEDIPLLILCTQNPDYLLPTTACIVQDRLGLPKASMCFDINMGCSGFIYSTAVASALMGNLGFEKALVVTSEAYSKVINYNDKTVATLFSDGAAATLLEKECKKSRFRGFNFGTDGSGYQNLIVPAGGSKVKRSSDTAIVKTIRPGIERSAENLYMNGQEITKFVFDQVPGSIQQVLDGCGTSISQIDRFIFHQANKYILEALTSKMRLDKRRVYIDLTSGNTVSSTIPIALKRQYGEMASPQDALILLSGFGVGYSWANAILETNDGFGDSL